MDFKKITNIFFLLALFFPLFYASAESKDYLAIDLQFNFTSQQFSILKIEQKVFETSDIIEYESATLTLNLVRDDKVISTARFPAPQQDNYSASNEDGVHTDVGYLDVEIINIALAITEPLQLEKDRIEINDSTSKIFSQPLSNLPIEVLSGTQPLVPEPELADEPNPTQLTNQNIILAFLAGLLIIALLWAGWHKNKKTIQ